MRIYNKVTIPIFDSNKFSKLIDKNSNNLLTYFDFVLTLLELHRNFPTSFNYGKGIIGSSN